MIKEEDKQLLLKVFCEMLPYGLKVYFKPSLETGEEGVTETLELIDVGYNVFNTYSVYPENVIPYLRPMSSMTEEERVEYNIIKCSICSEEIDDYAGFTDWLNEHHFDHRRLIEKGLALEAPEGMYHL